MKKFYWKAIINKMGKGRFILFIIATLISVFFIAITIKRDGIIIAAQAAYYSYLFSLINEFKEVAIQVNERYTVENKKNKKEEIKQIKEIETEVKR